MTIVEKLQKELQDRQDRGVWKYWTTMDENNGDMLYRLQHFKEEMLDACMYIQKIIDISKK